MVPRPPSACGRVSYASSPAETISAVAPRSGTGPSKRWKLASCSNGHECSRGGLAPMAIQRTRPGGVENRFSDLHQGLVQGTRVLTNVRLGASLSQEDCVKPKGQVAPRRWSVMG